MTRITDWKIPCVFTHVYHIIGSWGPGPYNSLCDAGNRKYFFGIFLMQNWREAHMFYVGREVGKFGDALAWKKVTLS